MIGGITLNLFFGLFTVTSLKCILVHNARIPSPRLMSIPNDSTATTSPSNTYFAVHMMNTANSNIVHSISKYDTVAQQDGDTHSLNEYERNSPSNTVKITVVQCRCAHNTTQILDNEVIMQGTHEYV
jgi:hypothetical protein